MVVDVLVEMLNFVPVDIRIWIWIEVLVLVDVIVFLVIGYFVFLLLRCCVGTVLFIYKMCERKN